MHRRVVERTDARVECGCEFVRERVEYKQPKGRMRGSAVEVTLVPCTAHTILLRADGDLLARHAPSWPPTEADLDAALAEMLT